MIRVRRSSLRLLSILTGVLFIGAISYTMHYRMGWQWSDPGLGRLPTEVVRAFLDEAYAEGNGATAVDRFVAPEIAAVAAAPQERGNAEPVPHEIRSIVAQGLTVVVFQRIGAARGQPPVDVIDVFEVRQGRIVRRERYETRFPR